MSSRPLTGSSARMPARRYKRQHDPGAPAPESGRERRVAARSRRMRRRQLNLLLGLLSVSWLPGLLGAAFGASSLRSWGALGGYTGMSWAIPALVVGLIVDRSIRERGLRGHRLLGIAAAGVAAVVLLLAAASIIGA